MKRLSALSCAALLFGGAALADESRVPIFRPTTITQPGSYVLTADIYGTASPVILIQSDNVTLDLYGHAIHNSDTLGATLQVRAGARFVRIRNGRMTGGANALSNLENGVTAYSFLTLERLEMSDTQYRAVEILNPKPFEMVDCAIRNTGLAFTLAGGGVGLATSPGFQGAAARIENNLFQNLSGTGVESNGAFNEVLIRRNVFQDIKDYRLRLTGGGARVDENQFTGIGGAGLYIAGSGMDIVNNVFNGPCTLAQVIAGPVESGNRFTGNVLNAPPGCSPGTAALYVSSAGNVIENNVIRGAAGCGLNFSSTASKNSYRGNMLRGNIGGPVCDAGTGNTDDGGNVY